MKIPENILQLMAEAAAHSTVTLTTLGADGWTHTRPMDLVTVGPDGESLIFGSVNAGDTASNLRKQRRAEVMVARRHPSEGYTLEGWAEYLEDDLREVVQIAKAIDPERPVSGTFWFHAQRIRVATPLSEETGSMLTGSQARRQQPFKATDFNASNPDADEAPPPYWPINR